MAQENNRPWVKWYKTSNWQRMRLSQLSRQPLCKFCHKAGIVTEANTVDHVMPHRGKMDLFFDKGNLQSLCKSCHSSQKQRLEKSGEFGCDVNGIVEAWK
jgi:5-methylcytosine-specific restriction endonuclease McrA